MPRMKISLWITNVLHVILCVLCIQCANCQTADGTVNEILPPDPGLDPEGHGVVSMSEYFRGVVPERFADGRVWLYTTIPSGLVVTLTQVDPYEVFGALRVGAGGNGSLELRLERGIQLQSSYPSAVHRPFGLISMSRGARLAINATLLVEGVLSCAGIIHGQTDPDSTLLVANGGKLIEEHEFAAPTIFDGLTLSIQSGGTAQLYGLYFEKTGKVEVLNGGTLRILYTGQTFIGRNGNQPATSVRENIWLINQGTVELIERGLPIDGDVTVNIPTFLNSSSTMRVRGSGVFLWSSKFDVGVDSVLSIEDTATVVLSQSMVNNGIVKIANGASLKLLDDAVMTGNGTLEAEGGIDFGDKIKLPKTVIKGNTTLTGTLTLNEFESYGNTVISGADDVITEIQFTSIVVNDGTFTHQGSSTLIKQKQHEGKASFRVNNALWQVVNNSEVVFSEVDFEVKNYDATVVFTSATTGTFRESEFVQEQGLVRLYDQANLVFVNGARGVSIFGGDFRIGENAKINGILENSGRILGLDTEHENKDHVFSIEIDTFIQNSTGELHIRRAGSRRQYNDSLITVHSAVISGLIRIENDEGLTTGDRIIFMKLDPNYNGTITISPDVRVVSKFIEDVPLALIVEDDAVVVVGLEPPPKSAASFTTLNILTLLLIIIVFC